MRSSSSPSSPEGDRDAKIRHFLVHYRGDQLAALLQKVHPHSYFVVEPEFGIVCAINTRDCTIVQGTPVVSRDLFRSASHIVIFGNNAFEMLKNRDGVIFPFYLLPEILTISSILSS